MQPHTLTKILQNSVLLHELEDKSPSDAYVSKIDLVLAGETFSARMLMIVSYVFRTLSLQPSFKILPSSQRITASPKCVFPVLHARTRNP